MTGMFRGRSTAIRVASRANRNRSRRKHRRLLLEKLIQRHLLASDLAAGLSVNDSANSIYDPIAADAAESVPQINPIDSLQVGGEDVGIGFVDQQLASATINAAAAVGPALPIETTTTPTVPEEVSAELDDANVAAEIAGDQVSEAATLSFATDEVAIIGEPDDAAIAELISESAQDVSVPPIPSTLDANDPVESLHVSTVDSTSLLSEESALDSIELTELASSVNDVAPAIPETSIEDSFAGVLQTDISELASGDLDASDLNNSDLGDSIEYQGGTQPPATSEPIAAGATVDFVEHSSASWSTPRSIAPTVAIAGQIAVEFATAESDGAYLVEPESPALAVVYDGEAEDGDDYGYDYDYDDDGYNYGDDGDTGGSSGGTTDDWSAINFNSVGVPVIVLADGFTPRVDVAYGASNVTAWSGGTNGTFTGDAASDWTYTETFTAPDPVAEDNSTGTGDDSGSFPTPLTDHGYDDLLTFTFTASGGTDNSYSVVVDGSRDADLDGTDFDTQTLHYELTVTLDAAGDVLSSAVSGTATHDYQFTLTDQPYGEEATAGESGGEGGPPTAEELAAMGFADDSSVTPTTAPTGTFSLVASGNSTHTFHTVGSTFASSDTIDLSYSGSGTYGLGDPADDESSGDGSGDDSGEEESLTTLNFTGSYNESGSSLTTSTINAEFDHFGEIVSGSVVESWDDGAHFDYQGSGTHSTDDVTGSISENGSDDVHLVGSITLTYVGQGNADAIDGWTATGNNTVTLWGDSYFFMDWGAPYTHDEDGFDLSGNAGGSTESVANYYDQTTYTLIKAAVDSSEDGSGDDGSGDDGYEYEYEYEYEYDDGSDSDDTGGTGDSSGDPAGDQAYEFRWELTGGAFNDFIQLTDKTHYSASGTYTGNHGVAAGDDGAQASIDAEVTGTVTLSGETEQITSLTLDGTYTPPTVDAPDGDVVLNTADLRLYDFVEDKFSLTATGPITPANSGGMTGSVTITSTLDATSESDITFDLIPDTPTGAGTATDDIFIEDTFTQTASGTRTIGDLSGTQWSDVNESSTTDLYREFSWDNSITDDEGEKIGGWKLGVVNVTADVDVSSDIGFDVSGTVTIDGLTGTETLYSRNEASTVANLTITGNGIDDPSSTFTANASVKDTKRDSLNLSGSFTDTVDPPDVTVTGTEHRIESNETVTDLQSNVLVLDDNDPVIDGHFILDADSSSDAGRSGTNSYTRVDGDTEFAGTVSLSEQDTVTTDVFLMLSIQPDGSWQLGANLPNGDPATNQATATVQSTYNSTYDAVGTVTPEPGADIAWSGTAREYGSIHSNVQMSSVSIPTIAPAGTASGSNGSGSGTGGEDSGEGDSESGDSGADSKDEQTIDDLPEFDWATTGTMSVLIDAQTEFDRNVTGFYDVDGVTGSAVEDVMLRFAFNRSMASELNSTGGDDTWTPTSGSGNSSGLVDAEFDLSASGPIDSGDLTGNLTFHVNAKTLDNQSQSDTLNIGTQVWESTGNRNTADDLVTDANITLSGNEETSAGGMPLQATRSILVIVDHQFHETTDQELFLLDNPPPLPAAGESAELLSQEERYEWKLTDGDRTEFSDDIVRTTLVGSGSYTTDLGPATITYSLTRNDLTEAKNKSDQTFQYNPSTEEWIGGGYKKEELIVDNLDRASGTAPYSFSVEGGSGTGLATHLIETIVQIGYDETWHVGTVADPTVLPDESGSFSLHHRFENVTGNTGAATFVISAGGASAAGGTMSFDVGSSFLTDVTFNLDRPIGQTDWNRSGFLKQVSGSHNNFNSSLSGDWGAGDITGTFSSTFVNNSDNGFKLEGPLNGDIYELDKTIGQSHDHQNKMSYSGSGTYATVQFDAPVTGSIVISGTDDSIDQAAVTRFTPYGGGEIVTGSGIQQTTDNSYYLGSGGGSHTENYVVFHPLPGGGITNIHTDTVNLTHQLLDDNRYDQVTTLAVVGGELVPVGTVTDTLVQNDRQYDIHISRGNNWTQDQLTAILTVAGSGVTYDETIDTLVEQSILVTHTFDDPQNSSNATSNRGGTWSSEWLTRENGHDTALWETDYHLDGDFFDIGTYILTTIDAEYFAFDSHDGSGTYADDPENDTGSTRYVGEAFEEDIQTYYHVNGDGSIYADTINDFGEDQEDPYDVVIAVADEDTADHPDLFRPFLSKSSMPPVTDVIRNRLLHH